MRWLFAATDAETISDAGGSRIFTMIFIGDLVGESVTEESIHTKTNGETDGSDRI